MMENDNLSLRYARVVSRSERLAGALISSSDLKMVEHDQKLFFAIEEDLAKIDLQTLKEEKVSALEEVFALLDPTCAFYGQEESCAAAYIAEIYHNVFVKNKPLVPAEHAKRLQAIKDLANRQEDERALRDIEAKIALLNKNAPSPSSFSYGSYQKTLGELNAKKKEIQSRLFKI
jgi:hypothetical protein